MSAKQQTSLIIGADSQIGSPLFSYLQAAGERCLLTSRRRDTSGRFLDLSEDLHDWQPPENIATVYICAAVTGIEDCEQAPQASAFINVTNTLLLAKKLAAQGAFIVFPSTSLVFDGTKPYRREDEPVSPYNEYGRQKAAAEQALTSLGDQAAIVRMTKVIWRGFPRFRQWFDALKNGKRIRPFADMMFSPVPRSLAVSVLYEIGTACLAGIWHLSGAEDISYAAAAYFMAEQIQAEQSLIEVISCEQTAFDKAVNPQYTTLDTQKLSTTLGIRAPDPWNTLETIIEFDDGKDQYHCPHTESAIGA